jgi:hypothetical protein
VQTDQGKMSRIWEYTMYSHKSVGVRGVK